MVNTLWRWSRKNDKWEWETECSEASKKSILRNVKRRSPATYVYRWTTDGLPPTRKYAARALKEK